ncbi:hypothetical protein E5C31_20650 [Providencia rettgeri]|uniref:Uncharacterized protein n=1 Tax=Providencia huaxiensis TaxID=2027290 RepID=A0ABU2J3X7_9GAMM|nr:MULTISPECIES: hypothetical protein [Providencia]MBY6348369.1 hypothetical protein [Providencia rettgeri]MBZ3683302.1 hypothetical protein [Providencia rettgeri]MCK9789433.1 hypothetical protein [Providencia rettgeri]MDB9569415.1 hypothetical protein [Providencia rettgeri]MDT0136033.1 hypothetical protein [Providencia huaxiensis]
MRYLLIFQIYDRSCDIYHEEIFESFEPFMSLHVGDHVNPNSLPKLASLAETIIHPLGGKFKLQVSEIEHMFHSTNDLDKGGFVEHSVGGHTTLITLQKSTEE